MPTLEQLITLIENRGVGFLLILGTAYLLYLIVQGVRKAVADFYGLAYKFVHNHGAHIQKSAEEMSAGIKELNRSVSAQNQILGLHGNKLDAIIDQTKK